VIAWAAVRALGGGVWRFLRSLPWQVWLGLGLLAAGLLYGQARFSAGAESRQGEVDAARRTAAAAVASNATLMQSVKTLQAANDAWAEKYAADKAASDRAVAAAERERDALQAELTKRRADRDKLYANDANAAAWGRTTVPDAVARSLRK